MIESEELIKLRTIDLTSSTISPILKKNLKNKNNIYIK